MGMGMGRGVKDGWTVRSGGGIGIREMLRFMDEINYSWAYLKGRWGMSDDYYPPPLMLLRGFRQRIPHQKTNLLLTLHRIPP